MHRNCSKTKHCRFLRHAVYSQRCLTCGKKVCLSLSSPSMSTLANLSNVIPAMPSPAILVLLSESDSFHCHAGPWLVNEIYRKVTSGEQHGDLFFCLTQNRMSSLTLCLSVCLVLNHILRTQTCWKPTFACIMCSSRTRFVLVSKVKVIQYMIGVYKSLVYMLLY